MPEERIRGSYGDVIKLCFGNLLRISIVGLLFFAFAFVACDRLPDAAAAHSARTRDDALTAEAASYFLSMDPDDMGVAPQHVAAVSCCLLDAPQAPQTLHIRRALKVAGPSPSDLNVAQLRNVP